jgi:flagellar basal-body rod protein FlgG
MNGAFHVGAIGLQAQQRALDVVSNNLANVNTPSFKRADIRFAAMLAQRADGDVPTVRPDGVSEPAGVATTAAVAMDEGGTIDTTGRAMDVAIRGRGFIELLGPDGQIRLWRGGTLSLDADGALSAAGTGLPLRAAVNVPAGAGEIAIAADGTVSTTDAAGEKTEVGHIGLVMPRDGATLEPLDGGLFRVADGVALDEGTPGEDGAGVLVQGGVERSNVDMTREMIQLMLIQRAYAANAQVVQAADQLMALANGLRR